jgi:hypothetical protein
MIHYDRFQNHGSTDCFSEKGPQKALFCNYEPHCSPEDDIEKFTFYSNFSENWKLSNLENSFKNMSHELERESLEKSSLSWMDSVDSVRTLQTSSRPMAVEFIDGKLKRTQALQLVCKLKLTSLKLKCKWYSKSRLSWEALGWAKRVNAVFLSLFTWRVYQSLNSNLKFSFLSATCLFHLSPCCSIFLLLLFVGE